MTIDDVLGAELASGRAVPTAVAGEPYESWHVISDDGQVELGIWEVTPGSFRGETDGIYESMHFVAGSGTITDGEGVVTEIRPGVVMRPRASRVAGADPELGLVGIGSEADGPVLGEIHEMRRLHRC